MDLYRWLVRVLGNAGAVANAGSALELTRHEEQLAALVAAHVG